MLFGVMLRRALLRPPHDGRNVRDDGAGAIVDSEILKDVAFLIDPAGSW